MSIIPCSQSDSCKAARRLDSKRKYDRIQDQHLNHRLRFSFRRLKIKLVTVFNEKSDKKANSNFEKKNRKEKTEIGRKWCGS